MQPRRKKTDDLRQVSVRLEPELHDELTALARQDRRSLNAYLTVLFERHVEEAKAAA